MNKYKNFYFILFLVSLFLFINYLFSEIDKKTCEQILLQRLSTGDKSIKLFILENFEPLKSTVFVPELKKLLKDNDENIRLKSAYLLASVFKDTSAINVLINILTTKPIIKNVDTPVGQAKLFLKNKIRASAAELLGEVGDEKTIAVLQKVINEEVSVADAAYFGISKIASRKGLIQYQNINEFFYTGLKDINPKVRLTAVKYLGKLKDTKSVSPLVLRLRDNNTDVRRESVISLGKIGDISAINELVYLKTDKLDSIRASLAEASGDIGLSLISSTEPVKIFSLKRLKDILNELLNDVNGTVRVTAAVALLKLNDRTGIELIKKGLDSDDMDIKLYCIKSLGNYGEKQDIELLKKFVDSQDILLNTSSVLSILKIYTKTF